MSTGSQGYCLVLGGGGAKGVYHIGVWRALRELGIQVDAFIGASIGAIIAAFLAQGSGEVLEQIGRTITVDNVLDLPREFTEHGAVKLDFGSLLSIPELFRSTLGNRGLDTEPFRQFLASRLDEQAIRQAGKDFGIVTVNVSDLKPREVFIEDMERGAVIDYLMASSAFPGFKQPRIDSKSYVDGGVYDNIPYAMARKRGYRHIIVSDISGVGRTRRPQIEGSVTVYIKNSIDMGGILNFDREFLESFMLLGYLDTLRAFGRLIGYTYFVEPDSSAEADYASQTPIDLPELPARMRYDRRKLLVALECAASILGVERIRAYTYAQLVAAVAERRLTVDKKIAEALSGARGRPATLARALRAAVMKRRFDECPYYYYRLIGGIFSNSAGAMLEGALVSLTPELPVGAAWLEASGAGLDRSD